MKFLALLILLLSEVAFGAGWTCNSYTTCYYCARTCNACSTSNVQDPSYPRTVNTLPTQFSYSKSDDITHNDTCTADCGTKHCNAGTTTYNNRTLPATSSACTLSDPHRLPHQLNCRFKDGSCYTYCERQESYSCCASWTYTP